MTVSRPRALAMNQDQQVEDAQAETSNFRNTGEFERAVKPILTI